MPSYSWRVKRYTRDPKLREFQGQVAAEARRIGELARGRGYVIYAIRDPSHPDRIRHHPDGPPVYVGQTKQLHVRANDHMRDAGGGSIDQGWKTGRLKQIMKKWVVPKFEILDEAPTHLTSLIAETVWARRFMWLGYQLANRWPEHQSKERPNGLASVPLERLWEFTTAEAIEDEVRLVLGCRRCALEEDVPLSGKDPNAKLNAARGLVLKCGGCGERLSIDVRMPDAATWRWRSYEPAPMRPRDATIRSCAG